MSFLITFYKVICIEIVKSKEIFKDFFFNFILL